MKNNKYILSILTDLYGNESHDIYKKIEKLVDKYGDIKSDTYQWVDEKDVMVITYADTIISDHNSGVANLNELFKRYIKDSVSAIHLLPFFNYSSDDGFSVIDYKKPNSEAGTWEDIKALSKNYDLMFDAVINHISRESHWFKGYLEGNEVYKDYFIECDPKLDYSLVTRPRALPLLTKVNTSSGEKFVWTTFSEDQIDLNYRNSHVLLDILDVLLFYVKSGARFIRLDAIGFMWKELGTTCMHHEKAHLCIKLMRSVIEEVDKRIILITETNTPQKENISYFGDEFNEAHMVYQFPLPPLTAHMFISGNSYTLLKWYEEQKYINKDATYFNFLASHDGVGLRPIEGILDAKELDKIIKTVTDSGGRVSYRNMPDGSKKPYELNISFLNLICGKESQGDKKVNKFIASQGVLLSVIGVPGIYIHSLLGSENDIQGMIRSGINRRINREKLNKDTLFAELDQSESLRSKVLVKYLELLNCRRSCSGFSPKAIQISDYIDERLFAITRYNKETKVRVKVRINISDEVVTIAESGIDLLTGRLIKGRYMMKPSEILWLV